MKKWALILPLLAVSISSCIAGDFTKHCQQEFPNDSTGELVSNCMNKIQKKYERQIDDLSREIQVLSKDMGSVLVITNDEHHTTNDAFINYMRNQCSMVGGAGMSRSIISEHLDCELNLMRDRINTLIYLRDYHYK
ncbi:hypothetical protein [Vibrio parahaemolyticus]|uniref:hypothetical protein n=1 Tax=Vibrio parahaemolyticus TaxID=670 RepID=UPI000C86B973|nr:hypothetical protein [Vibrio parahaemolyticus]EIA1497265.1 hypothetical protein [Vibrio parahaemolyticus]ELA7323351.1 hypothetical protein [Vibrio parahaemolyticus]PMT59065.1 hypothetical protein C1S87_22935 [Vibrio parahaemolyticus]PMT84141.1 hypothetical protein C1S83_23700 [Vibrio parahaemolyticus]PMT86011.1 hypothetical protein C1T03_23860 [Vibrio parahaemolyticus]